VDLLAYFSNVFRGRHSIRNKLFLRYLLILEFHRNMLSKLREA